MLRKLQTEFQQFKREAEIDKAQAKEAAAEIAAAKMSGLEGEIIVLKTTSAVLKDEHAELQAN